MSKFKSISIRYDDLRQQRELQMTGEYFGELLGAVVEALHDVAFELKELNEREGRQHRATQILDVLQEALSDSEGTE